MHPKNFGCCSRSSAAEMEWRGTSSIVGAFGWKTASSCHCCWYFFSMAIRVSRFSVCGGLESICEERRMFTAYTLQLFSLGEGQSLHGLGNGSRSHGRVLFAVARTASRKRQEWRHCIIFVNKGIQCEVRISYKSYLYFRFHLGNFESLGRSEGRARRGENRGASCSTGRVGQCTAS